MKMEHEWRDNSRVFWSYETEEESCQDHKRTRFSGLKSGLMCGNCTIEESVCQAYRVNFYGSCTTTTSYCWRFLVVFLAVSSIDFPSSEIPVYLCRRDPDK